jgi:predicted nucleic acid-binding protein
VSAPVAYLLDPNVLSETRRKKADPGVIAFLEATDSSALYISVLTLGELRKGIAAKGRTDPTTAEALASWLEGLEFGFADRILGVDAAIARVWGDWSADRPRPMIDSLLAATAAQHKLTFVTRNTRDISGLSVKVHNPWAG